MKLRDYVSVLGGKRIPLGYYYSDTFSGYKYLRVTDIDENGKFDASNLRDIPSEVFKILKRYKIEKDNLFLSIAGTIGKVGVIENELPFETVLTENAARLVLHDNSVNPSYLQCVLSTTFVQRQLNNQFIQTTIPKLGLGRIARLRIPKIPEKKEQLQVVELYRKALSAKERKYGDAFSALESIDDLVLESLGIELPEKDDGTLANRIFYTKSSRLTAGRFDPDALHSERINAIKAVESSKFPVEHLNRAVRFIRKTTSEYESGVPYIGLVDIESSTGIYKPSGEVEEFGSANLFKAGYVLFPKLRPYLNKVFLAPFDGVCSTEFHVLNGSLVTNRFLAAFLRNKVVVSQTKRLMTGNTLPRLQTSDIESLLIPIPPVQVQYEIADQVDAIYAEAKRLREEGNAILAGAKAEVEAMILGVN